MENLIILKLKFMFSKTHHKYKKKKKTLLTNWKKIHTTHRTKGNKENIKNICQSRRKR